MKSESRYNNNRPLGKVALPPGWKGKLRCKVCGRKAATHDFIFIDFTSGESVSGFYFCEGNAGHCEAVIRTHAAYCKARRGATYDGLVSAFYWKASRPNQEKIEREIKKEKEKKKKK